MIPYPHQIELADLVEPVLRKHGLAYLAAEERTGKTLALLLVVERLQNVQNIVIFTKKKAIEGWQQALASPWLTKNYTLSTYHSAGKLTSKPDFIILDEAHNYISAFPKPGTIWKTLVPLCRNRGILYASATPHAQGYQQLFHQFALSSFSPWKSYKNFYAWFEDYGKPYTIEVNGVMANQYDSAQDDKIRDSVQHLFITKTRAELGFEVEPEDRLHYIELSDKTKVAYNELLEHRLLEIRAGFIVADTIGKLRAALHMLEGGTARVGRGKTGTYAVLTNDEKIQYILDTWGDSPDLVIMYNYKPELTKLTARFSNALLLQATSYAEGVDLHKYRHLVIYSQDFSTARHSQRRARQANKNRTEEIVVHYLLVKGAISEQCYETVSVNKQNYIDSLFERTKI